MCVIYWGCNPQDLGATCSVCCIYHIEYVSAYTHVHKKWWKQITSSQRSLKQSWMNPHHVHDNLMTWMMPAIVYVCVVMVDHTVCSGWQCFVWFKSFAGHQMVFLQWSSGSVISHWQGGRARCLHWASAELCVWLSLCVCVSVCVYRKGVSSPHVGVNRISTFTNFMSNTLPRPAVVRLHCGHLDVD